MSLRNSPSTRELASCCQPRRVVPASWSSGSLVGGRAPPARASHDGGSNSILPINWTLHSEAACKKGVAGSPLSSATNISARGCRSRIKGMQSAQLAQKAGMLPRTALLNPRPPRASGMDAVSCGCSRSICANAQKHLHIEASCL